MPYNSVSEAKKKHPNLDDYSKKAQEAWVSAFNSAHGDGKPEGSCFAIAYSVANKIDGKKSEGSSMSVEKTVVAALRAVADRLAYSSFPMLGHHKFVIVDGNTSDSVIGKGKQVPSFKTLLNLIKKRGDEGDDYVKDVTISPDGKIQWMSAFVGERFIQLAAIEHRHLTADEVSTLQADASKVFND